MSSLSNTTNDNSNTFKIKDPGSAITHFIGMLMAMFAGLPLIIKSLSAPDTIHVISLSIFIVSMILLYGASTTYHTFDISPRINKILKKLDHCMISVMIAGSYTPVSHCPSRTCRLQPVSSCVGHCHNRHYLQALLGYMP